MRRRVRPAAEHSCQAAWRFVDRSRGDLGGEALDQPQPRAEFGVANIVHELAHDEGSEAAQRFDRRCTGAHGGMVESAARIFDLDNERFAVTPRADLKSAVVPMAVFDGVREPLADGSFDIVEKLIDKTASTRELDHITSSATDRFARLRIGSRVRFVDAQGDRQIPLPRLALPERM